MFGQSSKVEPVYDSPKEKEIINILIETNEEENEDNNNDDGNLNIEEVLLYQYLKF